MVDGIDGYPLDIVAHGGVHKRSGTAKWQRNYWRIGRKAITGLPYRPEVERAADGTGKIHGVQRIIEPIEGKPGDLI